MTSAELPPPHRHVPHTLAEIAEVLGHKTLAMVKWAANCLGIALALASQGVIRTA